MPCRGVYFALTPAESESLLSAESNDAVLAALEAISKKWDEPWLLMVDKSWDAMHRSLSNGTLYYDEGEYPLNATVLGGKHLYDRDDYVISYVDAGRVKEVAAALAPLPEAEFRKRYDAIDPDDYDGHGETDFQFTWGYLQEVRDFYKKAAQAGRAVVFKVDQ